MGDPAERLAAVAAWALDRMPDDLRADCQVLADLDPQSVGVRVHLDPTADQYFVVWVNRLLATVSGPWVRGELPADTGPDGLAE